MKKYLLLLFIFVNISTLINAQSLELFKPDGSPIVNDTIYIATTDASSDIEAPVFVKNISDQSKDIYVKLYVKQFTEGSYALYCWNSCFEISTNVSTAALTAEAGDTIKEFHSSLTPNGLTGKTEIMYTFFVNKSANDSVSVTITYDILSTTGTTELSEIVSSIKSYPNPVQNSLFVDYNIQIEQNATISIYNIVGKRIKYQELNSVEQNRQIDLSDLNTGMYIWSFEVDGIPIKTEKIMKQ